MFVLKIRLALLNLLANKLESSCTTLVCSRIKQNDTCIAHEFPQKINGWKKLMSTVHMHVKLKLSFSYPIMLYVSRDLV